MHSGSSLTFSSCFTHDIKKNYYVLTPLLLGLLKDIAERKKPVVLIWNLLSEAKMQVAKYWSLNS